MLTITIGIPESFQVATCLGIHVKVKGNFDVSLLSQTSRLLSNRHLASMGETLL